MPRPQNVNSKKLAQTLAMERTNSNSSGNNNFNIKVKMSRPPNVNSKKLAQTLAMERTNSNSSGNNNEGQYGQLTGNHRSNGSTLKRGSTARKAVRLKSAKSTKPRNNGRQPLQPLPTNKKVKLII
jgi:hypothetical protein